MMMRVLVVLLSLCLTLATVPPMPAFLWAGSPSLLTPGSSSSPVSSSSLAEYVMATSQPPSSLAQFAGSASPEVVLVFVQPQLQTSQVSELSDAFRNGPTGGALRNLKMFVENAPVSVSLPRVFVEDASILDTLSSQEGVVVVNAADAMSFLESNSKIFSNGHPDVIVVNFATSESSQLRTKLSEDDELMAKVVKAVADRSAERYVALFTAAAPGTSAHAQAITMAQQENMQMKSRTFSKSYSKQNNNNNGNQDVLYMTPGILSGLLITLLLFLIASCGVGGLMALETPDQWEKEGGALAGQ